MAKSQTVSDKKISIALHVIVWVIFFSVPYYWNSAFEGGNLHRLYQSYVHLVSSAIVFYIGYLLLVPRLLLQDKRVAYFFSLVGLILATYLFVTFMNDTVLYDPIQEAKFHEAFKKLENSERVRPPMEAFRFVSHVMASLLISGFAMGLGLMEKLKQNEKKQKEMEKEKLHSELAFLKNQVSPHFFFNTLNNIYSLIGIDGPTAQESVLKLSKMMRYLLYESENGATLMSHEIDFMNNYIDLMKLRLSSKVDLQIDFPGDFADFEIPPLLFIPFIENSFKHGISHRDPSFIKITMKIDKEEIRFISENSLGKSSHTSDMQHSGIGLDNVKKRLALLFPDKYELNIAQGETTFRIELSIRKEK